MLVRTCKDKNNPYVMLHKGFLEDINLSLKAKGLLAYCMSKPDGWQFNVNQLTATLKEGRKSIYSCFKELSREGYCVRTQQREKAGYYGKSDCILYEIPQKILPNAQKGDTDKGDTDKGDAAPYISKNDPSNIDISISAHAPVACGNVDNSISRGLHVRTTEAEHKKLISGYGEEMTQKAYIYLDEWKEDTPKHKWKKNDYRSILRWVIDVLRDKDLKTKDAPKSSEANEKIAMRIGLNYPARRDIVIGTDYIEFINGPQCEHVKFANNNFKQIIEHELRKRHLDTKWLKDH